MSLIEASIECVGREKRPDFSSYIISNNVPETLVKTRRETVWSWCFVRVNGEYRLFDFRLVWYPSQGIIHFSRDDGRQYFLNHVK